MIVNTELRIGNWVSDVHASEKGMWQVTSIRDSICHYGGLRAKYADLRPIPLTPDILKKCGFILETKVWWKFPNEDISGWVLLDNSPVDESFSLCYDQLVLGTSLIKNLHQLQNLYYSLTQTELNIQL